MKALLLVLGALCLAQAAEASPCAKQIAALEARHQAAEPSVPSAPALGPGAQESVDAKLHHQPTASSTGETTGDSLAAERAAEKEAHYQIEIEEAQAAEDSGDVAGCEAAVGEARRALSSR